jgi:hypothetical protein
MITLNEEWSVIVGIDVKLANSSGMKLVKECETKLMANETTRGFGARE